MMHAAGKGRTAAWRAAKRAVADRSGIRVEDAERRRIRVEDAERRRIRVGVGGWTYEPWRDNFYPAGWPKTRELEYASRRLSAIEINATYHGTQRRTSFAKWRDETPDDFVFSVKASRYATNRRVLAEAGDSIARFVDSGIAELGPKLGPIVWQFATTKHFEADDFEAFLALLPKEVEGVALRHVLDVRHASFMCPEYLALARRHGAATVFTDSDDYPSFADLDGRLRLCAADARRRGPAERLCAAGARCLVRAGAAMVARRGAGRPAAR